MRRDRSRATPRRRVTLTTAAMLLLLLLAAAAAARSAETPAARAAADPAAHFDTPDPATSLDLFGARFGQASNADLTLALRTYKPVRRDNLKPSPTSGLCVWLRNDEAPTPSARICIVPRSEAKSGLGLRATSPWTTPATASESAIWRPSCGVRSRR